MSRLVLAALVAMLTACRAAQAPAAAPVPESDRTAVLATVLQYVGSVSAKDTVRMRGIIMPGARYDTYVADGADSGTVRSGLIESQFPDVAARRGVIRARIWSSVVQVRDGIASVWTPYEVFVDERIGWCGIDHFTLLRRPGGWRISSVNYTRRSTTCVAGTTAG